MSTRTQPGPFDCYAKLEFDEPYFLLRGKDPVAPFLVRLWVESRRGSLYGILKFALKIWWDRGVRTRVSTDDYSKLQEARKCALSMWEWQAELPRREADRLGTSF